MGEPTERQKLPPSGCLAAFLTDAQSRGLSPRTILLYGKELGYALGFWVELFDLYDRTPDLIRRWMIKLGETRNPGGVHVNYRIIKTWLRWVWLEYDAPVVCPIAKVKPPRLPKRVEKGLSGHRWARLMDATLGANFTDRRDRALF